jgi:hypothetical protein
MNDILGKLGGKKMTALILYVLLLCFKDKIGIGPEEFKTVSLTLMGYWGAQGVADGLSKGKTSHK